MILLNSYIDPVYLIPFNLVVVFCGIIAVLVLACVHDYFSRHYTTVLLPGK
jgi:hypothetical protein